jgi:phage tail-like protein
MALTTKDSVTGDPLVSFHFGVEVSGKATGYFMEVSGIGSENEVAEHKVMSGKGESIGRKIPGRLKWNDITMKRGITSNLDFYEWRKEVEQGYVDKARVAVTITMFDQALNPIAKWDLTAAWPSKISGPSLKSDSSDIGVEEITICHEGIERTL